MFLYPIYLEIFKLKLFIRDIFCPVRSRSVITAQKFPWLWIGAEVTPGNFLSVTDTVNSQIEPGTTVDVEFLESVTSLSNVISWKYLDSQTLKEEEFPLIGIVIQE
jgi:hypothetical protein